MTVSGEHWCPGSSQNNSGVGQQFSHWNLCAARLPVWCPRSCQKNSGVGQQFSYWNLCAARLLIIHAIFAIPGLELYNAHSVSGTLQTTMFTGHFLRTILPLVVCFHCWKTKSASGIQTLTYLTWKQILLSNVGVFVVPMAISQLLHGMESF